MIFLLQFLYGFGIRFLHMKVTVELDPLLLYNVKFLNVLDKQKNVNPFKGLFFVEVSCFLDRFMPVFFDGVFVFSL